MATNQIIDVVSPWIATPNAASPDAIRVAKEQFAHDLDQATADSAAAVDTSNSARAEAAEALRLAQQATARAIPPGSVTGGDGGMLAAATISSKNLAPGSVTGGKDGIIADKTITRDDIAAGTISRSLLNESATQLTGLGLTAGSVRATSLAGTSTIVFTGCSLVPDSDSTVSFALPVGHAPTAPVTGWLSRIDDSGILHQYLVQVSETTVKICGLDGTVVGVSGEITWQI